MNSREYLNKYKPMNIEQLEAAKIELEEKLESAVNEITEKQYHGTLEEEYQAEEVRNELHKELSAVESVLNVKRWE